MIRLNREYRAEAAVLERVTSQTRSVNYAHHRVFVFVNSVDLAVLEALRYGRSLRPTELTAVHFVLDAAHADRLRQRWEEYGLAASLKLVDCPDRRLSHAASRFVRDTIAQHTATHQQVGENSGLGVTVLLPRRSYAPLLGRLLHDRSADRIARVLSRLPQVAATIIPYDVQTRIRQTFPHLPEERATRAIERFRHRLSRSEPDEIARHNAPSPESGTTRIGYLTAGHTAVVEGRVRDLTDHLETHHRVLEATLADATGTVTLRFLDPGDSTLDAGQLVIATGEPASTDANQPLVITNPTYQILESETGEP